MEFFLLLIPKIKIEYEEKKMGIIQFPAKIMSSKQRFREAFILKKWTKTLSLSTIEIKININQFSSATHLFSSNKLPSSFSLKPSDLQEVKQVQHFPQPADRQKNLSKTKPSTVSCSRVLRQLLSQYHPFPPPCGLPSGHSAHKDSGNNKNTLQVNQQGKSEHHKPFVFIRFSPSCPAGKAHHHASGSG